MSRGIKDVTESDKEFIKGNLGKLSYKEIAQSIGICQGSISYIAKKFSLRTKTTLSRIEVAKLASQKSQENNLKKGNLLFDEKFGSWNSINSYIFGCLWADGCISEYQVGFEVQRKDSDWAIKIGKWFDSDITICYRDRISKKGKLQHLISWYYSSKSFSIGLTEMGMIKSKSFLDPVYPNIPDLYFSDFIRGVFDGDGTISVNRSRRKVRGSLKWIGSYKFILGLLEQMVRLIGVKRVKPSKMKGKKIWTIQWGCLDDKNKLSDFLYNDHQGWLLERKYKRVAQLCRQELSENVLNVNP